MTPTDIRQRVLRELTRQQRPKVWLAKAAVAAGICSRVHIFNWLRGDRGISVDKLERILDLLEMKAVSDR